MHCARQQRNYYARIFGTVTQMNQSSWGIRSCLPQNQPVEFMHLERGSKLVFRLGSAHAV